MAIAYRSSSAVATGALSLNVAMPTGTTENDIMIMAVCCHDVAAEPALPAGWTESLNTANALGQIVVAWKRAGAAEAGPYSVTGLADSACGAISSYSGCRTAGSPVGDIVSRNNAAGASGTLGVTTTVAGCMVVSIAAVMDNLALSAWTATSPTTLTERFDGRTTTGSDTGVGSASAPRTTAGATGATAYTIVSPTYANIGACLFLLPQTGSSLIVANCEAAQAAGTLALAQDYNLATASCSHSQEAERPGLTTQALVVTQLLWWLISNPAVGGMPGPKLPHSYTIKEVSSYVTTAATTATYNIEERETIGSSGSDVLASDQVSDPTGESVTSSFNEPTLNEGNYLWIDISAVSGAPALLEISLKLEQIFVVEADNCTHAQAVSAITIVAPHYELTMDSCEQAQAASVAVASPGSILDSTIHAHEVSSPELVQHKTLSMNGAEQAQEPEAIVLVYNESGLSEYSVPGFITISVQNPAVGGIPLSKIPRDLTLTEISSYVTDATSVAFNIEQRPFIGTAGDDLLASDQVADTNGAVDASPVTNNLHEGQRLWLDISAVTGTPVILTITMKTEYDTGGVANCSQAMTSDNITLGVVTELVVGNCSHAALADSPTLTTKLAATVTIELIVNPVQLVVANCAHAQEAGAVTLTGRLRFYFPSSGASTIFPSFGTEFDETWQADVLASPITKGTTALVTKEIEDTSIEPTYILSRQYVTNVTTGLGAYAFTTADTFNITLRCMESNPSADVYAFLVIGVVSSDGLTRRGDIFSGQINSVEAGSALQSRYCQSRTMTGAVNMQDGDQLIFELGFYSTNTTETAYTLSMSLGDLPETALDLSNIDTGEDFPYIEINAPIGYYQMALDVNNSEHANEPSSPVLGVGLVLDNCAHEQWPEEATVTVTDATLVVSNCSQAQSAESPTVAIPPGRKLWVKANGMWVQVAPTTGS